MAELKTDLSKLEEATAAKNKPEVQAARNHFLAVVGEIEELMVEGFPSKSLQSIATCLASRVAPRSRLKRPKAT
ncbi:hypothetical protein [Synechococcus elongatus]|uniref:hypothetical protein n=1 Tax=Synechococcus elongatus TaxID=32046 RepID=UPI0030CA64DA